MQDSRSNQLATFGAGCFWGVEAAFRKVPGVVDATAGFMGGTKPNPSYEDVVSGQTGHGEVVQVAFDPNRVTYEQLLKVFWFIHDPTQRNRQGNDVGEQYRSVIFTHSDAQAATAGVSKASGSKRSTQPIVTEITVATDFYPAEDYHQQYLAKNPGGYCHVNLSRVEEFLESDDFNTPS